MGMGIKMRKQKDKIEDGEGKDCVFFLSIYC